jgi:ABC-2 type transport system permease protein
MRLALVRLRALLAKEFLQLLRDARMRFFVVVPPLVQLLIFGYAANYEVRHAEIAIVDQSNSVATREIRAAIAAGGHFTAHYLGDMAAASDAMDRNRVRAIVQIMPGFDRDPAIQLIADGSDPNSAQIITGELARLIQRRAAQAAGREPALALEERAWFNENLDDRAYFVPGVIATVLMVSTMILTAMAVVRERELGTLERLLVTPVARIEFLLGKLLPVACVGLFDVLLVSTVAIFWFDLPFRGSPLTLLVGSLLFLASSLGLGLLISSYVSTQQQAMLLAFFVFMPAIILSGIAFPIRNMPESVQWITWFDPLRYFLVVIRDVFLKGGGAFDHLFELTMMAVLGAVSSGLSLLRIR